jgi:hypothetical protein
VANEDKQEDSMLSEISQTQKDKYCMFSHIWDCLKKVYLNVE